MRGVRRHKNQNQENLLRTSCQNLLKKSKPMDNLKVISLFRNLLQSECVVRRSRSWRTRPRTCGRMTRKSSCGGVPCTTTTSRRPHFVGDVRPERRQALVMGLVHVRPRRRRGR